MVKTSVKIVMSSTIFSQNPVNLIMLVSLPA